MADKKVKSIEKQLDLKWSLLVKLRAGNKCEFCGTTKNLNSHHIYSRAKKSTRWSVDNGVSLCVGHHIGNKWSAHKSPMDFGRWLEKVKGTDFINLLSLKANSTSKLHLFEKEIMLQKLIEEINTYE
tara:strand:+ start:698 stop:1078 length:381 start_codon:yes stop_codon:yes gene_type:complete